MRAVAEVVRSTAASSVNFGLMNVRSAVNKAALIHDTIADHHLDITAITESWIQSDAPNAVKLDIAPPGYRVHHAFRGSSADECVAVALLLCFVITSTYCQCAYK